ncbi:TonB-dependent receptor [uncultured Xanthomonas sp.]|uniref:TonB-dependent receptor family protein n=1 Tax=uncultured Xanthomonas sp. TaxID=152831 RepID=UPI0025EF1D79|nr:TonB-dependent receptor [uncultured Xanthomonas sp.]
MSNSFVAAPPASRIAVAMAAILLAAAAHAAEPASPATLDAVQVRSAGSQRIQAEQALTPGAVTVLDGDSFQARAVNNMADSLRYVPGVWAESGTGGDAMFISSRGSNLDATDYDNNGVKLFQDGLPVTTADGNNHNRFMDPLAARYAIVARGANALTYGASNLGGAIDFVTYTARNSAPWQAFISGGSHGLLSGRFTAGGVSGDLDGQVTLEGKQWDGYREHGRQNRTGIYANGGWQAAPELALRAYAMHVDNREQLAGALTRAQFDADPYQANPSAVSGNFQWNTTTDRLALKGDWTPDADSRLEFGLSYDDQDLYHPIVDKVLVDFDGDGPNPPVEVFSLLKNTDQRTWAGMARYNVRLGDHDLLMGVNLADTRETGGNYRNDHGRRNGQTGIIDNQSDSIELFVVDRWKFAPDWTLVYGGQGVLTSRDVRTTDLASGVVRNPNGDYSSFNPRVGAIHAITSGSEAYGSISRLYEAPTTFELEDDVRGNGALLKAMHGVVYELGMRGSTLPSAAAASWHWDVDVYYAQIRDEILSVDDPAAPGTSLATNVDRTVHAGVEALVGASFPFGDGTHRIEPLISATYNDFHFDADPDYGDNALPAAPTYAIRGEAMYRHQSGFYAGPTFDLVGARYADFSNTYRIDRYCLVGLRTGFTRDRWEFFLEGKNLTDKHYVGTLSVRDRASPQDAILQAGAPRSVYAGVRFQY